MDLAETLRLRKAARQAGQQPDAGTEPNLAAGTPADSPIRELAVAAAPSLKEFYSSVLPAQGRTALFQNKNNTFFLGIDELVAATEKHIDSQGLYFATATYGDKEKVDEAGRRNYLRTQDNVVAIKAYRYDLDAGEKKLAKHGPAAVYATQREALAAIIAFAKSTGLVPTWIISSGEGLHVYWCLHEATTAGAWRPVAALLHKAGAALGLKIDPACTSDSARVLRPPGTLHPNGSRVSVRKYTGKGYTQDEFAAAVKALVPHEVLEGPIPKAAKPTSINDDILHVEGPPASLSKIAEHCSGVAVMRNSGGDVSEPHWRAVAGIAKYCEDGEAIFHDWSSGYQGYSKQEAQEKFDRWETPPTTCQHFALMHTGCSTCSFRGKVTTPKQLGYITALDAEQAGIGGKIAEKAPPQVQELNEVFFVAPDGSGKPYIFREFVHPETGHPSIAAMSQESFALLLANRPPVRVTHVKEGTTETTDKFVQLSRHYIQSPYRREYTGIALMPEPPIPTGVYNLWKGFAATPAAGDVAPVLAHVELLCGGDREATDYLLNWLAFCAQKPGQRPEVAVVIRGGRGAGKGTLVRLMLRLFGPHGLHVTNGRLLTGDFNGHMHQVLFLFVDEAFWAGDKGGVGILNGYITEPTIAINGKCKDVFTAVNRLKILFAANEEWVVPASADERRYFVLDVPNTRRGDHAYFTRLNRWIDEGGAGAWLHFLLQRDLSAFNPRRVPSTPALDRQKLATLGAFERWVLDCLEQGAQMAGNTAWTEEGFNLYCAAACARYAEFARTQVGRWAKAMDSRAIGAELHRLLGCGPARSARNGLTTERAWRICGLTEARERVAHALGLHHYRWPE